MRKPLQRTLHLKPIIFAREVDHSLADLLSEANGKCANIGLRMKRDQYVDDADENAEPQTTLVTFYNNFVAYENGAVFFEIWSFAPGHMPANFKPDPNAANATYEITKLADADGNLKEIINISHVLVYKGCSIIEAPRGSGGTYLVEKYINWLIRNNCHPRPPRVAFTTATSSDLEKEIEAGGGVLQVSLGLTSAMAGSQNPVAGLLSNAHTVFSKPGLVTLNWRAEGKSTLDTKEVANEARTAHDENFDQIFIKLKHGSINGLSKYKISSTISVKDIGGKNPDHDQVRQAMIDYLGNLLTPDAEGNRVLDDNGILVKNV